jgi:hypothetical protein
MRGAWIAAGLAVLAVGLTAPALAQQQGTPARLRGTVEVLSLDLLSIKTRTGERASVLLQSNWTVQSVISVKLEDLKPGDYVGLAASKAADGALTAEAIHYLPADGKAQTMGERPYDLSPKSVIINADIGTIAKTAGGAFTARLQLKDTSFDVLIPANTPAVRYGQSDARLLVRGAAVQLDALKRPNGTYTANSVRAETNGVKPPL